MFSRSGMACASRHTPHGCAASVACARGRQACPAIAVGCPVVVKPAEATPLSCFAFADILYEAGLPREWLQVVLPESHAVSGSMVADPRTAFFSFIGSARVGWMLRSTLAPGARCALEHGGVAPVRAHTAYTPSRPSRVRSCGERALLHSPQS